MTFLNGDFEITTSKYSIFISDETNVQNYGKAPTMGARICSKVYGYDSYMIKLLDKSDVMKFEDLVFLERNNLDVF